MNAESLKMLSRRDQSTVIKALAAAAMWEDSLAEAWYTSPSDPEYGKAIRAAARYRRLRKKLLSPKYINKGRKGIES